MATEKDLKVGVRVDATATGLDQIERTRAGVEGVGAAAGRASDRAAEFGDAAAQGAEQASGAFGRLRSGLTPIAAALGAVFAIDRIAAFVNSIRAAAETYAEVSARLKVAAGAQYDFSQAQRDTFQIAQEMRVPLESVAALYGALTQRAGELKLSQQQVADVARITAQSLRLSGASTESANGATTQFIQALSSGVLRGEEFNSVLEQAPRLAQALADGLGIPIGQLRALAEQGALTATTVTQALLSQRSKLASEYAQLPQLVSQSLTQLGNAWTRYLGELDQATGTSQRVAGAVSAAANSIETLVAAAGAGIAAAGHVGVVALAGLVQARREAAAAAAEQAAASQAEAAAVAEAAAIEVAAARAAQQRAVGELQAAKAVEAVALASQAQAQADLLTAQGHATREQAAYRLAAAEAALAEAQAQATASAVAAGTATERVAAAQAAAQATVVTSATGVGLLGRALGFLAGPGGILLTAIGAFAAFAASQKKSNEESREVERRVAAMKAKLTDLREAQLELSRRGAAEAVRVAAQELENADKSRSTAEFRLDAYRRQQRGTADLVRAENQLLEADALLETRSAALAEARQKLAEIEAEVARRQDPSKAAALTQVYAVYGTKLETLAGQMQAVNAAQQALADADATRAATLSRLAQLTGDQALAEQAAQAVGAAGIRQAQAKEAAERTALAIAEAKLARLQQEIAADAQADAGKAATLHNLALEVAQRRAAVEQLGAATEAARAEALAGRIAAETHADNAGRLAELRQAYLDATVTLETYERGQQLGTATAEQVAAARERQIRAEALYQDALADTVRAAELATSAEQRRGELAQAAIGVDIEAARAAQASARARGNDSDARRAAIRIAELEVQAARAAAEAKAREAAAETLLATAKANAALNDSNASEADFAAARAAFDRAKALELEAQKLAEVTKQREADAKAARNQTQAAQTAGQAGSDAIDRIAAGVDRLAAGTTTLESGFASLANDVRGLGAAAGAMFDEALRARGFRELAGAAGEINEQAALAKGGIEGLREAIRALDAQSHAVGANESDFWIAAYARAANSVKREFYATELAVLEAQRALEQSTAAGSAGMHEIARASAVARTAAGLLGEEQLSGLRAALTAAEQQVQSLRGDLESTVARLEDQNAQLKGNAIESERLRYVRERAEIEEQARAAQRAGDAEAIAAAARAQRLSAENHRLTLAQIAEQRRAERQRATEQRTEAATAPAATAPAATGTPTAAAPAQPQVVRMTRVVVERAGRIATVDTPEAGADAVVRDLARLFEVTR